MSVAAEKFTEVGQDSGELVRKSDASSAGKVLWRYRKNTYMPVIRITLEQQ